ncbi:CDP-diacylglycerol diphosphatase [Rhizobium sp. SAFR-030]|uniref:CDP-diacylglycerol pyrophosphatase n=1 Tax=Rhizobium sp. SAFR-030 TaxID=3387277 RepID=UPI003F7E53EF
MRSLSKFLLVPGLVLALIFGAYLALLPDGNALSKIIGSRCGLRAGQAAMAEPCLKVDRGAGYVVLRDRNGPHHYLLLPTQAISGMESATLLDPETPNYFWLAWENREFLSNGPRGINDDQVLLAINSRYGRSQRQLHIHISCMSADVRARLDAVEHGLGAAWRPIANGLKGNDYWVRRAGEDEIQRIGAFRLLSDSLPVAPSDMGRFSLAMTRARADGFLILATRLSLFDLNLASAEELQDHACGLERS